MPAHRFPAQGPLGLVVGIATKGVSCRYTEHKDDGDIILMAPDSIACSVRLVDKEGGLHLLIEGDGPTRSKGSRQGNIPLRIGRGKAHLRSMRMQIHQGDDEVGGSDTMITISLPAGRRIQIYDQG